MLGFGWVGYHFSLTSHQKFKLTNQKVILWFMVKKTLVKYLYWNVCMYGISQNLTRQLLITYYLPPTIPSNFTKIAGRDRTNRSSVRSLPTGGRPGWVEIFHRRTSHKSNVEPLALQSSWISEDNLREGWRGQMPKSNGNLGGVTAFSVTPSQFFYWATLHVPLCLIAAQCAWLQHHSLSISINLNVKDPALHHLYSDFWLDCAW